MPCPGLRANTTEGAREAYGTLHPCYSKKAARSRIWSSSPCDRRFIGRERGIGCDSPASAANSGPVGGSPSSAGSVNAGPSAAEETLPTSCSGRRRAACQYRQGRPACPQPWRQGNRGEHGNGRAAPPPGERTAERRDIIGADGPGGVRVSAGERHNAGEAGASNVRLRR